MQDPPFSTLLYRYFFFAWMLRDVESGDVFQRAAAVRHNQQQARWLPLYMLRWLWWGLSFCTMAAVVELVAQPNRVSTLLYAVGLLSVPFTVAIAAAWIGLKEGVQGRV